MQHIGIFRTFAAVMLCMACLLPMNGQNYVKTETLLEADNDCCITETQYFDGLGRKSVYTSNAISAPGGVHGQLQTYDTCGRAYELWLPAVMSGSGNDISRSAFQTLSQSTYQQDSKAYTTTEYDALGRPVTVHPAGEVWRNASKKIVTIYGTNGGGSVNRYAADLTENSLQKIGTYTAYTLNMEETIDEDGRRQQVYKDLLGRTVLERSLAVEDTLDTYYVYNSLGLLSYVLTPEYQKHPHKILYAYEYRYDSKGRLEKKNMPGCGAIRYYYDDDYGRVVYTYESNKGYKFYLYDTCGRLAINGYCSNFNYHHYKDVVMSDDNNGFKGTGYVFEPEWTLQNPQLDEVNYYDDYSFLTKPLLTSDLHHAALVKTAHSDATGLKTGSLHRTGTNKYVLSVIYYDEHGRPDDIRETQVDGSLIASQTQYDFTGNPLTQTVTMTRGSETLSLEKSFAYSSYNNRLESVTISSNGSTANALTAYEYDALGRLQEESQGNSTTEYSYNLRGWTTEINNAAFKEWLHYHDGLGTPQYGGNISSQFWKVSGEGFKRGYTISYDGLGRMLKAEYGEGENLSNHKNRYTEWVKEYTMSSGIRKLERYGKKSDGNYGKIDNLRLYYTGMRVDSVKEDALPLTYAGAFDFKSKTISTDDVQYAYYADGSLKWDANKGITLIEYDYFGYPKKICFSNGNTTEYIYTADGRKLQTIYKTAVPNISVALGETISLTPSNTLSVDTITYAGDFILENGQLTKYLYDGGYFTFNNGQAVAHYYIQDHQGNIRAVVDGDNHVEQINHYYPFGAVYSDAGTNDALQRYKYNGKELDRMYGLNQYDYGARNYDPLLCRFTQTDPLCEKYYNFSPYGYCGNNPVNRIDPDGLFPVWNQQYGSAQKYTDSETGKEVSWDQVNNYIHYGNYDGPASLEFSSSESSHTISPWGLGVEWLTGLGERQRTFVGGDNFTELLKKHNFIGEMKQNIGALIAQGTMSSSDKNNRFKNDLSGIQGVGKYIKDYSNLFTFGATENLAATYLGSYDLDWTVINLKGNVATVLMEVSNTSTLQSGTRPPVIGYTNVWKNTIGTWLNKSVPSGPMSRTSQKIVWVESIKIR